MKTITKVLLTLSLVSLLSSCETGGKNDKGNGELCIIPQPVKMSLNSGEFELKKNSVIYFSGLDLYPVAEYLADEVSEASGLELKMKEGQGKGINLVIREDLESSLGNEGYKLNVSPGKIEISAAKPGGLFYGIQTLLQMIPVDTEDCADCDDNDIEIRCTSIEDFPRFKWRGLLLDVSRHFFTIDEVKTLIDEMVRYKYNVLQLHLTDDQGWRIEIKKLPELTATGAWRVPRTGLWGDRESSQEGEAATDGGFFTQEEIKDLVEYASSRYVNILPEIEAPGHSLAAIASYPYLSSTGLKYKVNPGSNFYSSDDNSICAGKESSYKYMEIVLSEVADLFPFEYIHIGGDECYKGFWKKCPDCQKRMKENGLKDENELQSYFIKRLEKIVEAKGKKLIGWDEILEGGLAPNAAVMSWRGMEGGITAAKAKHHVVMSPVNYAYLDYYQGDPAIEPPTFAMLRLKKVYEFEPMPEGVDPEYILGGQGNLWTESVPTFRHVEYMLWPRSMALAEVLWSPKETRDWNGFVHRTEAHLQRLEQDDINFAVSFCDAIIKPTKDDKGNLQIELSTEIDDLDIYYTFDNTYPDHHSPVYKSGEKLSIPKDADTFRVITYRYGQPIGRIITVSLAELKMRIPNTK
jgi:hexosaminidase